MSSKSDICKGDCISEMQKSLSLEGMEEFFQVMQNCQSEEKIFEEMKYSYLSEIKEIIALLTDRTEKLMLSLEEMFLNRQRSQTSFLCLCLMIGKNATHLSRAAKCNCFTKGNVSDTKGIKSTLKLVSNLDKLKQVVSQLYINLKCDYCENVTHNEAILNSMEACMCSRPSADFQNKLHQTLLDALSKDGGFPLYVNYLKKASEFYNKKSNVSASSSEVESIHSFEVIPQEDYQEIEFCDCLCKSSGKMSDEYKISHSGDMSFVHSIESCSLKNGFGQLCEDNNMFKNTSSLLNYTGADDISDTVSETEEVQKYGGKIENCLRNVQVNKESATNKKLTPADLVKQSFSHYFSQPSNFELPHTTEKSTIAKPVISPVALKIGESAEKIRVNLKSSIPNGDILCKNDNKENVKDLLKVALSSYFSKENENIWLKE